MRATPIGSGRESPLLQLYAHRERLRRSKHSEVEMVAEMAEAERDLLPSAAWREDDGRPREPGVVDALFACLSPQVPPTGALPRR